MANNDKILTAEQEMQLRAPIDEYVGKIQEKINALRENGTDKVVSCQNKLDSLKRDRSRSKEEKAADISKVQGELQKAKEVEGKNKDAVSKLIAEAESYIKEHFDKEYYAPVKESAKQEREAAKETYQKRLSELAKEHQETVSKLSDRRELKDENYVYKNRQFDAKMEYQKELQQIKDRKHAAFSHKYHLIDMLRLSRFSFGQNFAQRCENYQYTFNLRSFLLKNGLYIAIILIFVALCILTPRIKGTPLQQCTEHSSAGVSENVPGSRRSRPDSACRYRPFHRPYGWYGYDDGHDYHASGHQYRRRVRTYLRFYRLADPGKNDFCFDYVYPFVYAFYFDCRLLYRKIQDASVHLHDGEHADDFRSCNLCDKGRILRCD